MRAQERNIEKSCVFSGPKVYIQRKCVQKYLKHEVKKCMSKDSMYNRIQKFNNKLIVWVVAISVRTKTVAGR